MWLMNRTNLYFFFGIIFFLSFGVNAQKNLSDAQKIALDSLKGLLNTGANDQALTFADSLIRLTEPPQQPQWYYSRVAYSLGLSYLNTGLNDSAAVWLQKSLNTTPSDSLRVQADIYEKYARSMTWRGLMDSALANWQKALDIYVFFNDSTNMRRLLVNLGLSHSSKGEFFTALDYQMKGLEMAIALKNEVDIRRTMMTIGDTYHLLDEYDKSLQYFNEALGPREDTVLSEFWKNIIRWNIGGVYLSKGSYDSAIAMARGPIQYYEQEDNICYGIYPVTMVAEAFLKKGQYDSAEYYASKSIGDALTCGENYILSVCHLIIGRCKYENGHIKEAEKLWKEAYHFATDPERKGELAKNLSDLYEKQNNADSAFKYFKTYVEISDTLVNEQKIRDIAKLEKEFEVKEEALKIESEYQSQILESKIKSAQANRLILILAVVVVAVLIISMLLFRQFLFKKRKNEELMNKNRLIESQKAELEELNNAKEKMISLLSHDIRNPLFGLEGSLNMLIEGGLAEEDFKNSAIKTRNKLRNISDFLDNLLNWAKSQLTGIKPKLRSVDASQLIRETIDLLQVNIASKQLVIENHIGDKTFVQADYEMIQTVIRNILGNAIKFTPKGNKIYLDIEKKGSEYLFLVRDEGIGLPENKDIFDLGATFNEGTDGEAGTGLGLSISKEFVEKHHGKIWAESSENGTIVKFTLPV